MLHPKYFGPNLTHIIRKKLHLEIEGTCDGIYGYIVAVTDIDRIGMGEIMMGKGFVTYPVNFKAVVFRPVKGEVIDSIVGKVNNVGIFSHIGPLVCFISRYNMPDDMEFDPSGEYPCYKNDTHEYLIQKGDKLRLRLINVRIDYNEISAAGTIREDFLGKFD